MHKEDTIHQELQQSEAQKNAIIEGFSELLVFFNQDVQAIWGNRAAEERYPEILGKNCHELFCNDDKGCHNCAVHKSVGSGRIERSTVMVNRAGDDTDEMVYDVVASPVKDSLGRLSGIIMIARNVSEKYALERQLRHTQKMEAIGTLAGGVAHDFNNILTPIMGYSEIVKLKLRQDDYGENQVYDYLEEILKAAKRAKSLVEQVLTFSRTVEKKAVLQYLHPIVKEVMKLMRATLPSTIVITEKIDENCGRVMIDSVQMHQVLINLCTNASQAMEGVHGELEVKLQSYHGRRNGDWIELSIRDSGQGIDKKNLERIFEPYFTTKEKTRGTGMGLAMVHGIITSQGGEIEVESEPGKGAKFSILLPVAMEGNPWESLVDSMEIERGSGEIILVDDDPQVVQVAGEILKNLGYGVTGTTSARKVLALLQENNKHYDLVLTDLTMPELTGLELSQQILKITNDLPVVLFTGYADQVSRADASRAGIAEFCMKPVSMRELAAVVGKLLKGRSSS